MIYLLWYGLLCWTFMIAIVTVVISDDNIGEVRLGSGDWFLVVFAPITMPTLIILSIMENSK